MAHCSGLALLLLAVSACQPDHAPSGSPVVLARHIDQLLDDPSGLPREATAGQAAEATPTQLPAANTPTPERPDAGPTVVDVTQPPDIQPAPDVQATPDVKPLPDVIAEPDVHLAPDVQLKPDVTAKPDVSLPPIVPIPVRRDGTPIVKAGAPGKPEPTAQPLPVTKPAKAAKLSAAERKKQAKVAAATAKAEAKAAAKKAQADKKKKAQAQLREAKKRAAAAKQKKVEAKKAALAAKKAAAWARKHPNAPKPEPAAKAELNKSAKTEPAKPEPAKTVKAEAAKPEPPVAATPQGGGDATELFFSGKRKADAGDFRGAIEEFKAAQAARPSPRTLTALGRAYFDAGEMAAAAAVLRKAGNHDDAQLLLGTLYQQMDKPDKARKVYEEFLKVHPDHAKADWVRKLLKTL